MAKRKTGGAAIPEEVQPSFEVVAGLVEGFCREHLNAEYADLCRKLTEKLARKRPSPLVSGKPNKAFGVAESTGQGKSALIRKLLKMRQFDWHWLLPSQIDSYPIIWTLSVNGFMLDIRRATREVQEMAFEKGLIPYIPADRGNNG